MSVPSRLARRTIPAATAALARQTPYPGFLGTGWSFPPTFVRQGFTVEMAAGEVDIRESIWIILATRLGERVMLPGFGSNLWTEVFTSLTTTTANEIAGIVASAIIEWEPRVTVLDVSVTELDILDGVVEISIDYLVRTTNTRSNLVFPYYLMEATLLAPPR